MIFHIGSITGYFTLCGVDVFGEEVVDLASVERRNMALCCDGCLQIWERGRFMEPMPRLNLSPAKGLDLSGVENQPDFIAGHE